ncbi:hypothetical protein [Laspinema olomoucense]|uniref:hypothetical protein n=1 Tax=Laspinema olomoucense TaxID=3231600 RepID=UPI0021BA4E77|nr:hypothetical protein [Laspinema sp. D3d]MCT7975219.1 hypothetical protein [Laspinema sp. D3d]
MAIVIAIGTLSFAAYAGKVPEELREAIHNSVIMACALIKTFDDKQNPPDQDPPDQDPPDQDPPDQDPLNDGGDKKDGKK